MTTERHFNTSEFLALEGSLRTIKFHSKRSEISLTHLYLLNDRGKQPLYTILTNIIFSSLGHSCPLWKETRLISS